MSIPTVLPFRGASAMHRDRPEILHLPRAAARARPHADDRFEMMSVTVASKDALLARRALLACPRTAIERCLPMQRNEMVKLEIRFPAGEGGVVIGRILAGVPVGEVGGIVACANLRAQARHANGNMDQRHGH